MKSYSTLNHVILGTYTLSNGGVIQILAHGLLKKKHEYYLDRERPNYEMRGILWKIKNRDYVACRRNAVNFTVAYT